MSRLTVDELRVARTRPQYTKLHLSVFQPRPVFKALVNNLNAARGDRTIPFDSVSLGNYLQPEPGMVVLVGSTDGARDIGEIRLRSINSTEMVVAENSIPFEDNLHLTVLRFFPVLPVYPRIIQDQPDPTFVTFYKDYDVQYSNQNSTLGTFVNAGPHRMVFRDCVKGIALSYWSSTGTFNLISGLTGTSYDWYFEGGSPTGSTSAQPGNVTYSQPGHYVTRLTVSGSAGSVDTAYRYISVYDYPGCGTGTPPLKWELDSLDGSRSEGGYTAQITLHETLDIHEGDVVVLFAEDWYGDTKQSIGGNHPNNSQIFFTGYILDDSIRYNYRNSTVQFTAGSITQYMKSMEGFSISVESKPSPSTWFELLDLDIRRGLYHYLRWQSTVLATTDFEFRGIDQKIQFFDADRQSLFDAADSLIRGALMGELVSDRQGKIWAEVQAPLIPNATGTFPVAFSLDKNDWMNEPRLDEKLAGQTSFIELGGIAYSGTTTGTYSALLSNAPGAAPAYRGKVERQQGLALFDQDQLNQLAGDMFAMRNARYPTIDLEMAGNYRNLDIAPQEAVMVDLAAEDTARGVRIRAPYFIQGMQWSFDPRNGLLLPRTSLKVITSGVPGETIFIPDVPPGDGFATPQTQTPTVPQITFPASFGFGVNSYILYRQEADLDSNNLQVVRSVGEFAGYPDLSNGAGVFGSVTLPSTGLYHICFTCNIQQVPDFSPPDPVFVRFTEFDLDSAEVQRAIMEFINLGVADQPDGKSMSVDWYISAGHRVVFGIDSAIQNITYNHLSIIKLSNL